MRPKTVEEIRAENEKAAAIALTKQLHSETLAKSDQLEETLVNVVQILIRYMKSATTKTEVTNPTTTVSTPDVAEVVKAVDDQTQKIIDSQPDLTELKEGLSKLESQLSQLPKEYPEFPELPSEFDVPGLLDAIEDLKKAVVDKELTVNAPDVNVEAPNVTVEPTDLKPLQEGLGKLLKAVKDNKPAVVKPTNLKKLEAGLTQANKYLKAISEKKGGGGGGGGGGSTFQDSTGKLTYPQLEADGSIPVTVKAGGSSSGGKATNAYSVQAIADDNTYKYFYFEDASLNWYIMRKHKTNKVFTYWAGTGGYTSVYVSAVAGPSGTPVWGTYGATF
jgi:hypothetical protein